MKNKWRILAFAVPIRGRALPLLLIPAKNDAFAKLRWKGEVDLIIEGVSLLLPLIPKGTIFIFDREFTYPLLIKFLLSNGMNFIIRLKRTVHVNGKPLAELSAGIYENTKVHGIRANVYVRGYEVINGKEKISWELYRERMKIEEMFRDEKNELSLELLSYIKEEEVLGRWLTIFMGALLVIYLVTKIKEKDYVANLLEREIEKKIISFLNFGLLIFTSLYRLRLRISKKRRIVLILKGGEK